MCCVSVVSWGKEREERKIWEIMERDAKRERRPAPHERRMPTYPQQTHCCSLRGQPESHYTSAIYWLGHPT